MTSFQISSELSEPVNHPQLPPLPDATTYHLCSRISKNNLLDIKFKFVNRIIFIFVSELETYGYKAEEIKEQLEQ
jgi:hypothetical protein